MNTKKAVSNGMTKIYNLLDRGINNLDPQSESLTRPECVGYTPVSSWQKIKDSSASVFNQAKSKLTKRELLK